MTWQFTPWMLPQLATAVIAAVVAGLAWRRRPVPGAAPFAGVMLAVAEFAACNAGVMAGQDLGAKLLAANLSYLGLAAVPPCWLLFGLDYAGQGGWLRRRGALLFIPPLLTVGLAFTNEVHGLMRRSIVLVDGGLVVERGLWFWTHTAYSYGLLLAGTVVLVAALLRHRMTASRTGLLVLGVVAPWLANLSYISGLSPLPRLDLTPFGFTVSGLILGWHLWRWGMLERFVGLVPIARNTIVEVMADAVLVLDQAGRVVDLNQAALTLIGPNPSAPVGRHVTALLPGWPLATLQDTGRPTGRAELTLPRGTWIGHFDLLVTPLRHDQGRTVGYLAVIRDVTTHRQAVAALRYQALHDGLTGLPNRLLLHQRLAELMAGEASPPLALLMLDLNRFKEVNDTFGHEHGDRLLCQVSQRLRDTLAEQATVARLGGDEFAVMLPAADAASAAGLAQRLLAALQQPIIVEGHPLTIGASVGIALAPEHGVDGHTLLRKADIAMYVAKKGRLGHALFSPQHDQRRPAELTLISDLHRALPRQELTHFFQPQLEAATGCIRRVEALVRWYHPDYGLLPPGRFLPLAEGIGLDRQLDDWALTAVLGQARHWLERGRALGVAVNLSANHIYDGSLPRRLDAALSRSGVPPAQLTLEITEGTLITDPGRMISVLSELRSLGVRIALDDFGTGYGSLLYLRYLPLDELKIDRQFITTLPTSPHDLAIVRSTIELGHQLGLVVVAEGVEDGATHRLLCELGCDLLQGHHISQPRPADELEHWLSQRGSGVPSIIG